MLRALTLLATLALGLLAESSGRYGAPSYSNAGITNAAAAQSDAIAPNSMASLYGTDLAFGSADAVLQRGNLLPTQLASVSIFIGNIPAPLLFVSPTQINFLIPASLAPGERSLRLVRQGTNGPSITIKLLEVAPALFSLNSQVAATHADGSAIRADHAAAPGEIVVLYASGLGPARAALADGQLAPIPPAMPLEALVLERLADLYVLLNGEPLEQWRIKYAGLTPGAAGLYQINLELPDPLPANPEIRIRMLDRASPEGLMLATVP